MRFGKHGVIKAKVVTGEMSHHDVLELTQRDISVILTEHSNSERAFLPTAAELFKEAIDGVEPEFIISTLDKDPLYAA